MSCKGDSTACPDQRRPEGTAVHVKTEWFDGGGPPSPAQAWEDELASLQWAGLRDWQEELREWYRQFGDVPDSVQAAKVLEEAGELGHAIVRLWLSDQNKAALSHRRMYEAKLRDAIGDVVVTVTHLATRYGWKMEDILKEVLTELQSRQYSTDKTSYGVT